MPLPKKYWIWKKRINEGFSFPATNLIMLLVTLFYMHRAGMGRGTSWPTSCTTTLWSVSTCKESSAPVLLTVIWCVTKELPLWEATPWCDRSCPIYTIKTFHTLRIQLVTLPLGIFKHYHYHHLKSFYK